MEYVVTKLVTENAIMTIRRPVLTEEERSKRMKKIHDAACDLWIAEERRKARLAGEMQNAEGKMQNERGGR